MEQLREEFEEVYAAHSREVGGFKSITADDIRNLRDDDGGYGERPYLTGCWEGYKMAKGVK